MVPLLQKGYFITCYGIIVPPCYLFIVDHLHQEDMPTIKHFN